MVQITPGRICRLAGADPDRLNLGPIAAGAVLQGIGLGRELAESELAIGISRQDGGIDSDLCTWQWTLGMGIHYPAPNQSGVSDRDIIPL